MNQNNPVEDGLEKTLQQYFSAPSPRPAFLADLEHRLQSAPFPASKALLVGTKRPAAWRPAFRPSYAALLLALALVAALFLVGPGTVLAALQGWLRYIPGFGLVEENTPLRVLALPAAQTRSGVTLTVRQAVLSPERASLTFTVAGLPPQARPNWTVEEKNRICTPSSELLLPDGARLFETAAAGGYGPDNVYQWVYTFQPLPAGVNEATWIITCLPDTLLGQAPQDWSIPLRFIPAPPGLTQLPVLIVSPSPVETTLQPSRTAHTLPTVSRAATIPSSAPSANPLSLDQVIETADGYIFIGQFRQMLPAPVIDAPVEILDANGSLLGYTLPADLPQSSDITSAIHWAYQVHQKDIAWPVTLRFSAVQVSCAAPGSPFILDVGPDPQPGQIFRIDQDFAVGPCPLYIDFASRTPGGYRFRFTGLGLVQVDPSINHGSLVGTTSRQSPTFLEVDLNYNQPPTGRLSINFLVYSMLPGPWQVQWKP